MNTLRKSTILREHFQKEHQRKSILWIKDIIRHFALPGKLVVHWCPCAFYNKDLQMAVLCFIGFNLFLQFQHTALYKDSFWGSANVFNASGFFLWQSQNHPAVRDVIQRYHHVYVVTKIPSFWVKEIISFHLCHFKVLNWELTTISLLYK